MAPTASITIQVTLEFDNSDVELLNRTADLSASACLYNEDGTTAGNDECAGTTASLGGLYLGPDGKTSMMDFKFGTLEVKTTGTFRLRIVVNEFNGSGLVTVATVTTDIFAFGE
jgi:hypothetical protein